MAGIGFELKKMLNKKSMLVNISGYIYATFASVGPLIVVVVFMLIMRLTLWSIGIPVIDQNILLASVTYSFMSSLILSGVFGMISSRYISDKLYSLEEQKIFPSFIVSVSLGVIMSGIVTATFLIFIAKLPLLYELLCYILCLSITTSFISMTYVAAVKNYKRITLSFIVGCGVGLLLEYILRKFFFIYVMNSIMAGFTFGFLIIATMLTISVYDYFKVHDDSYFAIFEYVKKMPRLVLINTFYFTGLFIHSIIVWTSQLQLNVVNTFVVAPIYDVPAFYALLSAMPIMVIFVIKTETTFYEYYKEYMKMLAGGGTLKDLKYAGDIMQENMYFEIVAMMQIQLMITALCIVLSKMFFPLIGFSDFEINIFGYMALGYFCIIGVHVISSIILYFDDRKTSSHIMIFFLLAHIICVIASIQIGTNYIGLGSVVAGLLTFIFAFIRMRIMLKSMDYRLYCSQPVIGLKD